MATLKTLEKQPGETQDYDFDFTDYLAAVGEDVSAMHTAEVEAAAGITLGAVTVVDGVVKVWLSGGEDRGRYKVTVTLTTAGGRIREADATIRVRER